MKKLFFGLLALVLIFGGLWLASYLLSFPAEALEFAKTFGIGIWFAAIFVWLVSSWYRKAQQKKEPIQPLETTRGKWP